MNLEDQIANMEGQMLRVANDIAKIEDELSQRIAKGDEVIAQEPNSKKKVVAQIWRNYLNTWLVRVASCRKIMDQTVVLIAQEGNGLLVVKQLDENTMNLVKVAQQQGGVVTSVESDFGKVSNA